MTVESNSIIEDIWGDDAIADDRRFPYSGAPIGIICIKLDYPKIPGNVVNAQTYDFPVLYEIVDFNIERLFEGDPKLIDMVVESAKKLEAAGVRAIVGACGYFAHFQNKIAESVSVPVFMSSLCQLPMIRLGLGDDAKIAVLCANGENLDERILEQIGETPNGLVVCDVSELESFSPIRWGKGILDNAKLAADLAKLSKELVDHDPNIECVLLECSDLPPYAYDIQRACGLPVFDFITMIDWVAASVTQHHYVRRW